MNRLCRNLLSCLVAASALALVHHSQVQAQAPAYPAKPIRLVVGYPPGGATDGAARLVAGKLGSVLGQPVLIDNKPGAASSIGAAAVAQAAPDGYTLLMGSVTAISIAPHVYRKPPYDPRRDFVPVALVGRVPQVLVVNPSVAANDLGQLVELVRQGGGSFDYATFGAGSSAHLTMEMLRKAAKLDMTHVPYKGSGAALADVIGGQVPMAMDTLQSTQPFIRSGKLRAIATSAEQRTILAPDLPTFSELGYPELTLSPWYGVFAPAGTPDAIVEQLAAAITQATDSAELRSQFAKLGVEPMRLTGAAARSFLDQEHARWGEAARVSGAYLD